MPQTRGESMYYSWVLLAMLRYRQGLSLPDLTRLIFDIQSVKHEITSVGPGLRPAIRQRLVEEIPSRDGFSLKWYRLTPKGLTEADVLRRRVQNWLGMLREVERPQVTASLQLFPVSRGKGRSVPSFDELALAVRLLASPRAVTADSVSHFTGVNVQYVARDLSVFEAERWVGRSSEKVYYLTELGRMQAWAIVVRFEKLLRSLPRL